MGVSKDGAHSFLAPLTLWAALPVPGLHQAAAGRAAQCRTVAEDTSSLSRRTGAPGAFGVPGLSVSVAYALVHAVVRSYRWERTCGGTSGASRATRVLISLLPGCGTGEGRAGLSMTGDRTTGAAGAVGAKITEHHAPRSVHLPAEQALAILQ